MTFATKDKALDAAEVARLSRKLGALVHAPEGKHATAIGVAFFASDLPRPLCVAGEGLRWTGHQTPPKPTPYPPPTHPPTHPPMDDLMHFDERPPGLPWTVAGPASFATGSGSKVHA